MQDSQALADNIDTAREFQYFQSLSSIDPLQDIEKIIVSQSSCKVFTKIREIQSVPIVIGPVALDLIRRLCKSSSQQCP
jgi:hypothetical protein